MTRDWSSNSIHRPIPNRPWGALPRSRHESDKIVSTGISSDWYAHPLYYDIVFGGDTGMEVDFLEEVYRHYGRTGCKDEATILEPACGTGRLAFELARRGHQVDGFDLSSSMLKYARSQRKALPPDLRKRVSLRAARMESFRPRPGRYDLAFCLLSTIKYLLTEDHALSHLKRVSRSLKPGGLYVIGIHLADYRRRLNDHEQWIGEQDGVRVVCDTTTGPADPDTRLEDLTNRLVVNRAGHRRTETIKTRWKCRTYDAAELKALLAAVPDLTVAACHDFSHRLDIGRLFDDSQEDLVLVLQKNRP